MKLRPRMDKRLDGIPRMPGNLPAGSRYEIVDRYSGEKMWRQNIGCYSRDRAKVHKTLLRARYPETRYELYIILPSKANNPQL